MPRFRLAPAASLLALIAAWLALFGPVLFGGRALFFGDIGLYFVPQLSFQQRELFAGRIPLWNPYLLCGTPFLGNPQAWPLYPSSLLLWTLSPERAVGAIGAAHCLFAALGVRALLKRRGCGEGGAALGALAWGMGGFLVSKLQFPNMVQAAAYLPWLLWGVERALDRPDLRRSAVLGLLFGLAILAAHPQMTLMQVYLIAAWVGWRVSGMPRGERRAPLIALALAAGIGLLLSAGQWLPVVPHARDSVRAALTLRQANRFILPPYALPTAFVAPNFYGNPATAVAYVARGNFWEPCAYAGLLSFVLAIGAVVRLRRSEIRFWSVAALIGVWLAVGKSGGLYTVAFILLPGVAKFHDPARFLHLATFALAMLAGFVADAILRKCRTAALQGALGAAFFALTAIDLLPFCAALNPTVPVVAYDIARARLTASLSGAGRIWHADERGVWRRYVSYRRYRSVATVAGAADFLSSAAPNLPLLAGVRDAGGYEPVRRADYEALRPRLESGDNDTARILSVDRRIGAVPETTPALSRARGEPGAVPLVVHDPTPQRVEVQLPPGRRVQAVVLADTMAPGWQAFVDDRPTSVSRQGVLRRVVVGPEARSVTFRYEPAVVRVGLFLSFLGAGILGAFSGGRKRKKWPS